MVKPNPLTQGQFKMTEYKVDVQFQVARPISVQRERGSERERGSVRRRGCGGKKNGRGTGSSGMRKRGQGCVLLEMQERRKMRTN